MVSDNDVREVALSLPATSERPSYGTAGFRVRDRLFARLHELPDVLVLWCAGLEDKEELVRSRPEAFFTTSHYDGHAAVLLRLGAVDRDELTECLTEAWRARAPARLRAAFDAGDGLSAAWSDGRAPRP